MIIFMGVAGAGKSMQGRMIADELGLPWLSTGEFLRMLISGQRRSEMLAGKLLDDSEIIALVQKIFSIVDTRQEFVLDGFPRTLGQAEWLLSQVKAGLLDITAIFHITATEDVVRNRLLKRARQDDTEDSIKERFEEYRSVTLPIVKQFSSHGISVHQIDGDKSVDEVRKTIREILSQKAQ